MNIISERLTTALEQQHMTQAELEAKEKAALRKNRHLPFHHEPVLLRFLSAEGR